MDHKSQIHGQLGSELLVIWINTSRCLRQIAKLTQGGASTRPGSIEKLLGPQPRPYREEDFRGCEDPVGIHWSPDVQSHLPHPTHLHAEVACALTPHDPDPQAAEQVSL